MSNAKLVTTHVFSMAESEVMVQALSALLRERSLAYEVSAQVAKLKQRSPPDVADFGLSDILRLVRLFGKDPVSEDQSRHRAVEKAGRARLDREMNE